MEAFLADILLHVQHVCCCAAFWLFGFWPRDGRGPVLVLLVHGPASA